MQLHRSLLVVLFTLKKSGIADKHQLSGRIYNCDRLSPARIEALLNFWVQKGLVEKQDGLYQLTNRKSNLDEALHVCNQLQKKKHSRVKLKMAFRQLSCQKELLKSAPQLLEKLAEPFEKLAATISTTQSVV